MLKVALDCPHISNKNRYKVYDELSEFAEGKCLKKSTCILAQKVPLTTYIIHYL